MKVGEEKRADSLKLVDVFHPNSNWSLGRVSGRGSYAATQTIRGDVETVPTDQYLNQALLYLFQRGAMEVKAFNKPKLLNKMSIEIDGV